MDAFMVKQIKVRLFYYYFYVFWFKVSLVKTLMGEKQQDTETLQQNGDGRPIKSPKAAILTH